MFLLIHNHRFFFLTILSFTLCAIRSQRFAQMLLLIFQFTLKGMPSKVYERIENPLHDLGNCHALPPSSLCLVVWE